MPRKGENIYKRKDGRWEGRSLRANGKYRYFYASTYREVRAKMKEAWQEREAEKKNTIPLPTNPGELFQSWLSDTVSERVKPTTYESYYHCIHGYVIPYFKSIEYQPMSQSCVCGFVKSISENASISQTYKRKIISVFKMSIREIYKDYPNQPKLLEAAVLPTGKTHQEVSVFTMKEQRILEQAAFMSPDKRALGIILCFYTGIRLGELCALRWRDIDLEAGIMYIGNTVSRIRNFQSVESKTMLHIGTPKSKTSTRKIPLPGFLLELAKELKPGIKSEEHFILSNKNTPFEPRVYQKLYKRILKDTGIKDRKFHAIRHTFATRALEVGVDIKTLSEILGHSNVTITLNIYAHSLMEQKKAAIEKLNMMHVTQMKVV